MNKVVLSILALLSLQQFNLVAAGKNDSSFATAANKGKAYLKKYGPGALKIAAGVIWLKRIDALPKTTFHPLVKGSDGAEYNFGIDLTSNGTSGTVSFSKSLSSFGSFSNDSEILTKVPFELRTSCYVSPLKSWVLRLPVVAQAYLISSGAYDLYKAYKQG